MAASGSHMSKVTPNFPVYWDSTMLGTYKECAKRFHYQHILGYQPRKLSVHLDFGRLYHAGLERYEHARAEGLPHAEAVSIMVHWALTASWDMTTDEFYPEKTRPTLLRSLVWKAEENKNAVLQTVILHDGKPAIELSFRFPAFEVSGELIHLNGHLDKVATFEGEPWVIDHKTTKGALTPSYFRQFSPHNQFSLYTIAGKIVLGKPAKGVIVQAAQILVNGTRFAMKQVTRSAGVLAEWMRDTEYWINLAYQSAVTDHWPQNDKSCDNYGGCPFQAVCAVAPNHRKSWLEEGFEPWSWNPLEIRGDI